MMTGEKRTRPNNHFMSNVEDEFHFVIEYNYAKKLYNYNIQTIPSFLSMSKQDKFNFILSSKDFLYQVMEVCVKGIFELSKGIPRYQRGRQKSLCRKTGKTMANKNERQT